MSVDTPGILAVNRYKAFWLSWEEGTKLRFGHGLPGGDEIISYDLKMDVWPHGPFKAVSVRSEHSKAKWLFEEYVGELSSVSVMCVGFACFDLYFLFTLLTSFVINVKSKKKKKKKNAEK